MHHNSAGKYYKMNLFVLLTFLGISYYTYKQNTAVFWNESFGKVYLGLISAGILGMWIFANKQVHSLYLLRDTKNIGIMTYTNFGMTYTECKKFR